MVLVKHGADIHKEDIDGDTPLKIAKNDDLKRDMQGICMHALVNSDIQIVAGIY